MHDFVTATVQLQDICVSSEHLCTETDTKTVPTTEQTLSDHINQKMKKNNQRGVNAAYKSLNYCKPRRHRNYPQVLWNYSKMHSLVKCAYPDVKIKLKPFLDSKPENAVTSLHG